MSSVCDGIKYLILIDGDNGHEKAKTFYSTNIEIKILNKEIIPIKRFQAEIQNELSQKQFMQIQQEWKNLNSN